MSVALLTFFYPCATAERRGDEACLERNAALAAVDRIVVFSSGGEPPARHAKITTVPVRRRPTWSEVFEHANARLGAARCLIAHGDIHFDDSLTYFDDVDFSWTCLTVRRRDADDACRPFDAIAFEAPLPDVKAGIPVGGTGAEGRLAHELLQARFTLRDVSGSVKAFHVHGAPEPASHPTCRGPTAAVPSLPDGPKVLGIGLQRTGTSSLRTAMNVLGIPTLEHLGCWFLVKLRDGEVAFDPTVNHTFFQGFADSPVPLFFRELDALFPDSRFVYTTRDLEPWLHSVERLFRYRSRWRELPQGGMIDAFHELTYGVTDFERSAFEAAFERHREEVLAYFRDRADDLLILDCDEREKWERLCRFLKKPVPRVPYPHGNRSRFSLRGIWKRLASA